MFGCVAENALENPFLSCFSHFLRIQNKYYYRESKYINNTRNKNQNKKNQNHKTNRERGIERDWFVGATRRWTRWVDLKVVGRSRSGSLIGWVDRFVVRSERSTCERGWRVPCERGVSEVISTFSLFHSLSLFARLRPGNGL